MVATGLKDPDARRCRCSLARTSAVGRGIRDPPCGDSVGGVLVWLGMRLGGRVPGWLTALWDELRRGRPLAVVVATGCASRA